MGDIKTNIDSSININSFSIVNNSNNTSAEFLANNSIAPVDSLDLTAEVDNLITMANEGNLSKENIDFSRIATTADAAKNGQFLKESSINDSYWGDNGQLTYKIRDDGTIMIFEDSTLLGFTDKLTNQSNSIENIVDEPAVSETVSNIVEEKANAQVEANVESVSSVEVVEPIEPEINVYKSEPISTSSSLDNNVIKTGVHYTTGNTTYPMSNEDFYRVVSCIEAESNGDYVDALAVASVIANRIDDGRFNETTPLGIVSHPNQFAAWDFDRAERYASNPSLCQNVNIIRAAEDVFFNGIRNNDYVEFKSAGSPNKSITGEVKYQFVDGGNKFHNLAQSLDRVDTYLASSEVSSDNVSVLF